MVHKILLYYELRLQIYKKGGGWVVRKQIIIYTMFKNHVAGSLRKTKLKLAWRWDLQFDWRLIAWAEFQTGTWTSPSGALI